MATSNRHFRYFGKLAQHRSVSALKYRNAKDLLDEDFENHTIGYVEDFIGFFLERNPEFSHLHYCLGFINKVFKQASILAKKHFTDFLNCVPDTEFIIEQKLANKWITELLFYFYLENCRIFSGIS